MTGDFRASMDCLTSSIPEMRLGTSLSTRAARFFHNSRSSAVWCGSEMSHSLIMVVGRLGAYVGEIGGDGKISCHAGAWL